MAFVATSISLSVGFPVAYYLSRCSGKARQVGLILLFIPFWTNFILRIYGLVSLFGNNGLINQIILSLGITNQPIEILFTRTGVFIGLVYNYLPFLVVPIYSALEKLDPTIKEAAADLGASRFQTFFLVTVPNVKDAILTGCLFVFIPMLGEYVIPDLLGGAKETFLGNILVNQFFVMQNWPLGSAIAGILSMLLLIALLYQFKKNLSGKTNAESF
jgi:putrescine transport system permease protein